MNEQKKAQRNPADDVDLSEQWQSHWQRKQQQRKKRLRGYVALIFFTALFGFVNISLRLDLRKPPQERFYQNLSAWLSQKASQPWTLWKPSKSSENSGTSNPDVLKHEELLQERKPNDKDLQIFVGKTLTNIDLDSSLWGDFKRLRGSNEELDILYFAEAQVYLIRKKGDNTILYASNKKP